MKNLSIFPSFHTFSKSKAGYSMFIAVIIMASLTIIAFSVINISVKETQFATSNRESQYAIFAADAGIECALYWDGQTNAFSTSTLNSITCAGNPSVAGGQAISGTTTLSRIGGGGSSNPTSVFGLTFNNGANPTNACVIVTVTKNPNASTYIYSRGYNNCDLSDPRRVERGIEVRY
ncbi:MAG TPA: pilus assembly PilX N-terminal domain-containing protein [Candidatus Paceibacterota bacterium]